MVRRSRITPPAMLAPLVLLFLGCSDDGEPIEGVPCDPPANSQAVAYEDYVPPPYCYVQIAYSDCHGSIQTVEELEACIECYGAPDAGAEDGGGSGGVDTGNADLSTQQIVVDYLSETRIDKIVAVAETEQTIEVIVRIEASSCGGMAPESTGYSIVIPRSEKEVRTRICYSGHSGCPRCGTLTNPFCPP